MMNKLTHLDDEGRLHMVDVGAKADTERVAVARGEIHMAPATLRLIVEQGLPRATYCQWPRLPALWLPNGYPS